MIISQQWLSYFKIVTFTLVTNSMLKTGYQIKWLSCLVLLRSWLIFSLQNYFFLRIMYPLTRLLVDFGINKVNIWARHCWLVGLWFLLWVWKFLGSNPAVSLFCCSGECWFDICCHNRESVTRVEVKDLSCSSGTLQNVACIRVVRHSELNCRTPLYR